MITLRRSCVILLLCPLNISLNQVNSVAVDIGFVNTQFSNWIVETIFQLGGGQF